MSVLVQQKIVSHIVCYQNLILYQNGKHQYICREENQTQNTPFLYWKLLEIWYFMLHLDYVERKDTP